MTGDEIATAVSKLGTDNAEKKAIAGNSVKKIRSSSSASASAGEVVAVVARDSSNDMSHTGDVEAYVKMYSGFTVPEVAMVVAQRDCELMVAHESSVVLK